MFSTGTYMHTLDPKGRLTLPAIFRKEIGDSLRLVPYGDSLRAYTPEDYQAWLGIRFPNGTESREDERLQRLITSRTTTVEVDKSGRICLAKVPERNRAMLGDERELAVVGVADHLELYTATTWTAMEQEDEDVDISQLFYK